MAKILFVHRGTPGTVNFATGHYMRSINADFFFLKFSHEFSDAPFPLTALGFFVDAFHLPRNYEVYIHDGTIPTSAVLRKTGLQGRDKLNINILADALTYRLFSGAIGGARRMLLLSSLQEADGFVHGSKMIAELSRKIVGYRPSAFIYPFIKEDLFAKLDGVAPNLKNYSILFIAHGSDWWYKGADIVIESFKIAKHEIKELSLNIVGGGWRPEKEWLVEGVNFLGHKPDLAPIIQNSSLYLHLARGEAFGASVVEAMLGGVPAMVSEWTGAKEVVSGLGSDFISELNPESAAKKILKYFDLSLEKKMQLSKKAKNLAREFRRDKLTKEFKKGIFTLLAEMRSRK